MCSFFTKYTPAVDIWGIGCIFAEVLLLPLFPGKNVVHQLELITDLLGTPSEAAIARVRNDKARNFLRNMKHKPGVDFRYKFPNASPEIRAILARLLAFDPNDRIGAAEALADPFFASLTDPGREEGRDPISKVEFAFEAKKLTMENIKELIYREILEYHPNMLEEYERGGNSSSFMYPSAVDRFRQQFMNLEAGGRASLASSARAGGRRLGNSASLPRQSMEKLYKEFEAKEQDGQ